MNGTSSEYSSGASFFPSFVNVIFPLLFCADDVLFACAGDGAGDTAAPHPGNILNGERNEVACFASFVSQYRLYASRSKEESEMDDPE
tara:strand:+ start:1358 stop:1621 length:264 start_codon:yes stop_codon:yes gene_type:complete